MSATMKYSSAAGNPLLHPMCAVPGPNRQECVILQWQHYAPCIQPGALVSRPTHGGTVVAFVDDDQDIKIMGTIAAPPVNLMPVLTMQHAANKTLYFQTLEPAPQGGCKSVNRHWAARWDPDTCTLSEPRLFDTGAPNMLRHNTGLISWDRSSVTVRHQDKAKEFRLPVNVLEAHQDGDALIIIGGPGADQHLPNSISFVYRFMNDTLECALNGAGKQITAKSAAWLPRGNTLVWSMNSTREMRVTTNQTHAMRGVQWALVSQQHSHLLLTKDRPPEKMDQTGKQTWRAWTVRLFNLPVEELPADLVELRVDYDKAVAEAGGEACTTCELGTIRKAYLKRLKKIYE